MIVVLVAELLDARPDHELARTSLTETEAAVVTPFRNVVFRRYSAP